MHSYSHALELPGAKPMLPWPGNLSQLTASHAALEWQSLTADSGWTLLAGRAARIVIFLHLLPSQCSTTRSAIAQLQMDQTQYLASPTSRVSGTVLVRPASLLAS